MRDSPLFAPAYGPLSGKEVANGKAMQRIGKADYSALLEKAFNRLKAEQNQPREQPMSDAFLEMCLAVDRALTAPCGSILMAGQSGMGRRAAVTLVTQMHQIRSEHTNNTVYANECHTFRML